MNQKQYIGAKASSFEKYNEIGPITGISLLIDDENEVFAGDDSGYVLTSPCAYGTQRLANEILTALRGKVYKGYMASNVLMAPGAELGDGVTIQDFYSMLASRKITFGASHAAEISAPGENEVNHEYPYIGETATQIKSNSRKISDTNSRLTKTADEIRADVSSEMQGLSSSIDVKLDGITSRVEAVATGAKEDLDNYAASVTKSLSNLQTQIDGQIETWYYDYEPKLTNAPASGWSSELDKAKHEGDLFYWKSKGYAYRFFKDGTTWKWQMVQDTDISLALGNAKNAQDTADNKRRVCLTQPKPPYDAGDLWSQGPNGELYRCNQSRATGENNSADWGKASKYTDDTRANSAYSVAEQAADHFSWLVSSGTSSSDFTITDRLASLTATHIDLSGYVTFNSLKGNGTTEINGSNITTGTIAAERVNLSAYSTTAATNSKISSEIKSLKDGLKLSVSNGDSSSTLTLTSGGASLSSASITFTGLVNFVNKSDIYSSGKTTIDGGKITAGSISADKLSVADLNAFGATIGGWSIDNTSIYTGSVGQTNGIKLSTKNFSGTIAGTPSDYWRFVLGGNFGVLHDGQLYANNVHIKGAVTATSGSFTGTVTAGSGSIGGFTIGTSSIYNGLSSLSGSADGVYLGTDGISLGGGKFKVTKAGALTATSVTISGNSSFNGTVTTAKGTIGGWNVTGNSLYVGADALDSLTAGSYIGKSGIRFTVAGSTNNVTDVRIMNNAVRVYSSSGNNDYHSTFIHGTGMVVGNALSGASYGSIGEASYSGVPDPTSSGIQPHQTFTVFRIGVDSGSKQFQISFTGDPLYPNRPDVAYRIFNKDLTYAHVFYGMLYINDRPVTTQNINGYNVLTLAS